MSYLLKHIIFSFSLYSKYFSLFLKIYLLNCCFYLKEFIVNFILSFTYLIIFNCYFVNFLYSLHFIDSMGIMPYFLFFNYCYMTHIWLINNWFIINHFNKFSHNYYLDTIAMILQEYYYSYFIFNYY